MYKMVFSAAIYALIGAATLVATTDAALARGYHRTVWAQGAHGRGYTKNVDRHCGGGTCTGHRSVQTNGGYGYTADHNRTCADHSCNGTTTVTGNNGRSWTRSRGVSGDGDGGADWYSNTTGPNGGTVQRSGSYEPPHN